MKIEVKKLKFIRNIFIGVIALCIVAFIINVAPGFKRNKYKNVINLVVKDENVTEYLKNPIYMDEDGGIYISKDDITEFFDKNFYYDEKYDRVITTSNLAVASMKVGEKLISINNATNDTLYSVIYNNGIMYIPIEELESVYNIDVEYIQKNNVVVVDKLNDGLIKAEVDTKTDIRFKPRRLSKKIETLEVGDSVSAFYTTSKGWRQIRTGDGIVGYVKANVLTNEYIVRQDMDCITETQKITANISKNSNIIVEDVNIVIKDFLEYAYEGAKATDSNYTIWATLDTQGIDISDYETRTNLIKNIIVISRKNNINAVNIPIDNKNDIKRFVIELAPRLKDIGIKTNIITNEDKCQEEYNSIVNYIIKPE